VIGDLLLETQYGTSKKAGNKGRYPVLRMNNITPTGGWNFSELKYMDLEDSEIDRYTVQDGDILFNRTNSPDLVGKTAVYREAEPMAYAGYLVRGRVNENANPEYIAAYLNSVYGKRLLRSMCKSIIGMANINATEFRGIRIPKPPKSLQDDFARYTHTVHRHQKKLLAAASELDDLSGSLAQRAFRGEL
jgi:type I restriction enzyme S subunit